MKKYRIGKVVNTHGLRGEMKIYPYTDYPERFQEIQYFYLDKSPEKYEIDGVKFQKTMPIIKVKGIDSIEAAESLRGKSLYIDESNLRELDEDEYMISDLVGLEVRLESGKPVGKVVDVLQYTANDIYVVRSEEGKEYLIPALKEFVSIIDIERQLMIITPIEGML